MADEIMFQGDAISVRRIEGGIAEIVFDLKGDSVNKFNLLTLKDLRQAVDAIDTPICKLEAGSRSTFYELSRPAEGIRFRDILESLTTLRGITLQSLFVDGHPCNVETEKIADFFGHVCMIQPREVQVYSTDCSVNHNGILQLSSNRLEEIADCGSAATGIPFRAYYSA